MTGKRAHVIKRLGGFEHDALGKGHHRYGWKPRTRKLARRKCNKRLRRYLRRYLRREAE